MSGITNNSDTELLRRQEKLRDLVSESACVAIELTDGDAIDFVAALFDSVISQLRDDPQLPRRTRLAWELTFADIAAKAERKLADLIDGRVDRNDVIEFVADALVEEAEEGHEV